MKLRPLNDRILVKPVKEPEKTPGGIYIPETADKREPARSGEVLAVGAGKLTEKGTRLPMLVEPGQVIWYGKYAGTEITVEGEELRMVSVDDVLGVQE